MPKILEPTVVGSPEWLQNRQLRITATDAGKLLEGMTAEQLVKHKLTAKPIVNNQYLTHGTEREPFIANEFEFLFGLTPTDDIYVSDEDERFAASPDAVNEDLSLLGEYKTVKAERAWANRLDAVPRAYYGQVLWQMFVTGARKVIFGWEPHDDFEPMQVQWMEIEYDEALVKERILPKALEALKLLEGEVLPLIDSSVEKAIAALMSANQAQELAAQKVSEAREKLGELLAEKKLESYDSTVASVSYKIPTAAKRFDSKLFKTEHPELYAKYQVQGEQSTTPVLRVTIKKEQTNE